MKIWLRALSPAHAQDDALHQIVDIGEIEAVAAVAVDGHIEPAQRVLDERLADAPADAALAVERRGPHDRVGQAEYLMVGDDEFLAGILQRAIDADRLADAFLGHRLALEIAVDHGRRKEDEVLGLRVANASSAFSSVRML